MYYLLKPFEGRSCFSNNVFIFRHIITGINKEHEQPLTGAAQIFIQGMFLQTVGFPHLSTDTVPVDRFLKKPGTYRKPCLQAAAVVTGFLTIYDPEREMREGFPFPEELFNALAAF
jgi:hypothetical protein